MFWGHAINAVHLKVEAAFPHLYGPFGVDLFFVISGFVMVYSSERLFGRAGRSDHILREALGAYCPPLLGWQQQSWFGSWFHTHLRRPSLAHYFLLHTFLRRRLFFFVGWTLIFEMFFYAVFAIALFAKRRFAVVAGVTIFLICFSVLLAPDTAGPSTQPPPASGIAYLADPIISRICVRHDDRARLSSGRSALDVGYNQYDHCWCHLACGNLTRAPATVQRRRGRSINCSRNVSVDEAQPKTLAHLFVAWCFWATCPTPSIARTS